MIAHSAPQNTFPKSRSTKIIQSDWSGIMVLIAVILLFELLYFGDVFLHPNDYCIMLNPDGTQILFNYAFHIKHGGGVLLKNQAHPFYELIFMTDAQASLSILMSFINEYFFSIEKYSVGIFNSLILYSIPLCGIFLFKIFRESGMRFWISIFSALAICFLSPQWVRITGGHYGLGYLFFFPALIYLMMMQVKLTKFWPLYTIALMALLIFFGLNNGHMSLAGCAQVGAFGLGWLLFNYRQKGLHKYLPFLSATLSFGCIVAIIRSLDSVTDREKYPWGFSLFYSKFESIFLPTSGKLYEFIHSIQKIEICQSEGEAYIGFAAFLCLLFILWRIILFIKAGRFGRILLPTSNPFINILLLTSLPILFFAMGYPFRFGMESLLDHLQLLRQFRAPGRLSWIFYYCFSIFFAYQAAILIRWLKNKFAWILLSLLLLISYSTDIFYLQQFNFRYLSGNNYPANPFRKNDELNQFLAYHQIDTSTFQGIFGVPLCNAWNSKFGPIGGDPSELVLRMAQFSYHTGIPWLNAKLSRISTSGIVLSAQMVSHPIIKKELPAKLPNQKSILLIHPDDYQLNPSQKYLFDKASFIDHFNGYSFYKLNQLNSLNTYSDSARNNLILNKTAYIKSNEELRKKGYIIDQQSAGLTDAITTDPENDVIILDHTFELDQDSLPMEFSIWAKLDHQTDGSGWIEYVSLDSNQHIIEDIWFWSAQVEDYQKGYLRTTIPFQLSKNKTHVRFILKPGKGHVFERMLIKPKAETVYQFDGHHDYLNNYRLE